MNWKKVLGTITILGATLILSSCGGQAGASLQEYVKGSMRQQIINEVNRNQEELDNLHNMGLVDDTTYKNKINTMQALAEQYNTKKEDDLANVVLKASSHIMLWNADCNGHTDFVGVRYDEDGKQITLAPPNSGMVYEKGVLEYFTENSQCLSDGDEGREGLDSIRWYWIGNYVGYGEFKQDNAELKERPENKIQPIPIMAANKEKEIKEFNNKFRIPVYVLRPEIAAGETENITLDNVIALVQQEYTKETKDRDYNKLINYFMPAINSSNEEVILFDPDKYPIIGVSETGDNNELGQDLLITQDGYNALWLRCVEFNQSSLDKLHEVLGDNEQKYMIVTHDGQNIAIQLEYPVQCIGQFKTDKSDDDKLNMVEAKFVQSGIGLNLYNNKIIKYKIRGTKLSSTNIDRGLTGNLIFDLSDGKQIADLDNEQYYYVTHIDTSTTEQGEDLTSFVMQGYQKVPIYDGSIDSTVEVTCGRIILRDYLEVNFAPQFVSDEESAVVFGRKIRFDMSNTTAGGESANWVDSETESTQIRKSKNSTALSDTKQRRLLYNKNNPAVAWVIDRDGRKLTTSQTDITTGTVKSTDQGGYNYTLTDFCDYYELNKSSDAEVKVLAEFNQAVDSSGNVKTSIIDSTFDSTKTNVPKVGELKQEITTVSIKPTSLFPSYNLGKDDFMADTEDSQRFIGIATKNSLFDANLMSNWINSTSTTASLTWWNNYLLDTNMSYQIDQNQLNEYLNDNYSYELNQEGIVILDLDTINKIQKELKKEQTVETNKKIKSIFMIVGWLIIIYAIFILLCWSLDTTTDIGIKLLEKVSFGRWIAVKEDIDIPRNDTSEVKYLTLGGVIIKSFVLIAIGFTLIFLDIFNIIYFLVNSFGKVSEVIERLVEGIR